MVVHLAYTRANAVSFSGLLSGGASAAVWLVPTGAGGRAEHFSGEFVSVILMWSRNQISWPIGCSPRWSTGVVDFTRGRGIPEAGIQRSCSRLPSLSGSVARFGSCIHLFDM